MAATTTLAIERRDHAGTGAARAVRRAGKVPGVIYGAGKTPELFAIDPRIITKNLQGGSFFSTVFTIALGDGEHHNVIVRDVQLHPISDAPIHMDLMRVTRDAVINVMVPVKFLNEDTCEGLRSGGILSVVRHEVELNCPATDIPAELVCDLEQAKMGDTITISHIALPDGVKPVIDRDFVICNIEAPRAAISEAAEAESEETTEDETE